MTEAVREAKRLGAVLAKDKMKNPTRFSEILKKETENFLSNFFEYDKDSLCVFVSTNETGDYDFVIKGRAKRLRFCM